MAEAIVSRRGYTADGKPELKTEIITYNQTWTVPKHKGNISVLLFGSGSSGNGSWEYWYGGSGYMNNGEFDLAAGTQIPITIGAAQTNWKGSSGEPSAFGVYLSANGGSDKNGGAGGVGGGDGGQFGGGGCKNNTIGKTSGGNGGIWGGGGGGGWYTGSGSSGGGHGGTYGGGGGGSASNTYTFNGGDGGTYGGGGGAGFAMYAYDSIEDIHASNSGIGGTYGGNGGYLTYSAVNNSSFNGMAENGTNTIGNQSVPMNLRGNGEAGGFVQSSVSCYYPRSGVWTNIRRFSADGGGGFGGKGGTSGNINFVYNDPNYTTPSAYIIFSGSGGGGYGGRGGNGDSTTRPSSWSGSAALYAGGGGGYGGNGEDGFSGYRGGYSGGGGGYFSDGKGGGGGGYYNYCHGGGDFPYNTFSFGTGGCSDGMAMPGACIIQYYA